jgi:hypothetical protein
MLTCPLKPLLYIPQEILDDLALYESQEIDLMRAGELPNQVVTPLQDAQARFGIRYEVRKPENFHRPTVPISPTLRPLYDS